MFWGREKSLALAGNLTPVGTPNQLLGLHDFVTQEYRNSAKNLTIYAFKKRDKL
jgi:hypothetical protein